MKPELSNRNVANSTVEGAEPTELQWTAFRYLTDELTPQLATDFEQQLSDEPAAAEALEQMLCLLSELEATGSIAGDSLATPAIPGQRKAKRTDVQRTVQWLAAIAAAVLVWLGISQFASTTRPDSLQGRFEASHDGEEMAELWASDLSDDSFDSAEDPPEDEPESDDWLYAALVSLESLENWPTEEQGGS